MCELTLLHATSSVAPEALTKYLPALQEMHKVAAEGENLPALQGMHAEAPAVAYVPAAQLRHVALVVAATVLENLPAGQVVQSNGE